jgi:hypothetical protein
MESQRQELIGGPPIRKHHVLRGKFWDSETYIAMAIVSKEDLYLLR